jgi:hypothetical protein
MEEFSDASFFYPSVKYHREIRIDSSQNMLFFLILRHAVDFFGVTVNW